ncbi:4-hydroxy-tetrahydrodipicolinate reductase [Halapricum hydrolyticum]|uniref:4-hydroxy-tetrahydrodipicolinate reductase n=1 Tax=Halapricum hydrolyticum TaxID=2979991 RepID=A0AAE3I9W7_9EURY|nr:4-hydroxy-tetrahydrodipicolinate reductase [Halapricum hydrolyticum]MCU4717446.1 4-hydroxy-tetrahydrodipicolinate reductase [Halapricum hydrolyticum]MCU4726610.1 4-hydroxy-tetrahydrodipicolinate reductase [Halapricum hydrolyticum]
MISLGVSGAAGRMGEAVIETAAGREDVEVVFGVDTADVEEVLGVPIDDPDAFETLLESHDPDAVIDFTVPRAATTFATACAEAGVPLVTGTTGHDDLQFETVAAASERTPVLKATNFARGIQALLRTVSAAVEALPGYDIEVTETHHNGKRDAPSGTANTILEEIQDAREADFEEVYGREGIQPREEEEIGVHVRRAGDIRGEHEVMLAGNDEVVTLAHRAEDRGVFAAGAIDAAVWLSEQESGWYEFSDVIDG